MVMPEKQTDFAMVKTFFEPIMLCIFCPTMFEDTNYILLLC